MNVLKNDLIQIVVKSIGAELVSLKKTGEEYEYMWTGDAGFWSGQSPVLFPMVGSVYNETTLINGHSYELKNHGFARRNEFLLKESDGNRLVFALCHSSETLKMYPFCFELRLIYTLQNTSVIITYEVENLDSQEIYFQLGTHPGFNCPMTAGKVITDYFLEFEELESAKRFYCNDKNLIIEGKEQQLLDNNRVIPLTSELFYDGALIFRDIRSKSVILKSYSDDRFVRMSWENFPYLGIWQPKNAPFVCIEPWHGVGDNDTNRVEFKQKEQIVTLQPTEIFKAAITIGV